MISISPRFKPELGVIPLCLNLVPGVPEERTELGFPSSVLQRKDWKDGFPSFSKMGMNIHPTAASNGDACGRLSLG
jgi:hypothetical protein